MQTVADVIRTTLGPRSMLKMLLDASGGTSVIQAVNAPSQLEFYAVFFGNFMLCGNVSKVFHTF